MLTVLQEIQTLPGVVGTFVFHGRRGVLGTRMPSVFRPPILEKIGRTLGRIFGASEMACAGVSSMSVFYEETSFTVFRLFDDVYLVAMCEPNASPGLIAMSVKLVLGELQDAVRDQAAGVAAARPMPSLSEATPEPLPTSPEPVLSEETLLASPEFGSALQSMRLALAKVLGPMARIVFSDSVRTWLERAGGQTPLLPDLMEIIGEELGDPESYARYQAAMRRHLSSAS